MLNYELDTYLDALQQFPDYAETLDTTMGTAHLIKKDIFKNLMWYVLPNNTKHFPLTIQRVKEIKRLNQQGQKVDELQPVEITGKQKEIEPAFVDLVGQISLKSLERNDRRRRDQERSNNRGNAPRGNDRGPQQGSRDQGARPQGPRPPQQNRGPQQGQGGQQQRPQGPRPPQSGQGGQQQRPQGPRPQQPRPPQAPPPSDNKES